MLKSIKTITFIFLLISSSLWITQKAVALEDAIIAVVNDEIITLKDLQDYIRKTYVSLAAEGMPSDQLQQVMMDLQKNGLDKLIDDKIILSEAKRSGLEVRDKLVDDRIEEIKERYPSEQIFHEALVKNGANMTELRNKINETLSITFIIDHEVKSKIYVNPQEVTKFYEDNLEKFRKKERVNLDSIFIANKGSRIGMLDKAEAALKEIEQGADFKEVAERYSDAPSIGVVERGQLMKDVEDAIFSLRVDEISDIVEVDSGTYIFHVTGKNETQLSSLKEVKDTIYNIIYKQKFRVQYEEWLAGLKEDAYIEIKK